MSWWACSCCWRCWFYLARFSKRGFSAAGSSRLRPCAFCWPESGVGGLVAGDDVEVLGTHAGTVRRIVINLPQRMYAVAEIDDQVRAIGPRDSTAVIRRQFGIAGVIEATNERAATDSVNALIDETREKIYPVLTDAGRVAHSLAAITERVERGEGSIGHVLADDALSRNAEAVVASANDDMKTLDRLLTRLDEASADVGALVPLPARAKPGCRHCCGTPIRSLPTCTASPAISGAPRRSLRRSPATSKQRPRTCRGFCCKPKQLPSSSKSSWSSCAAVGCSAAERSNRRRGELRQRRLGRDSPVVARCARTRARRRLQQPYRASRSGRPSPGASRQRGPPVARR